MSHSTAKALAQGIALSHLLLEKRIDCYEAILERDASQNGVLRGWLRRANQFRA